MSNEITIGLIIFSALIFIAGFFQSSIAVEKGIIGPPEDNGERESKRAEICIVLAFVPIVIAIIWNAAN